jgi:hypothetical protein
LESEDVASFSQLVPGTAQAVGLTVILDLILMFVTYSLTYCIIVTLYIFIYLYAYADGSDWCTELRDVFWLFRLSQLRTFYDLFHLAFSFFDPERLLQRGVDTLRRGEQNEANPLGPSGHLLGRLLTSALLGAIW